MSYPISEVARRTGFNASAIRYYEAEGIVPEPARTASGYRVYDERAVDRLVLVSRAKELGCTLQEIRELVQAWDTDECGPVKHHLRGFVAAKITEIQRHIAEQVALASQLQRAAATLASAPLDGPCDDVCGCLSATPSDDPSTDDHPTDGCSPGCCASPGHVEPVPLAASDGEVPIACSLDAAEIGPRIAEWQAALAGVVRRETREGGVRLVFDDVDRLAEVARLAAAEHRCCPFFSFAVTVDARGLGLEVQAPADGQDVLTAVFGTAA